MSEAGQERASFRDWVAVGGAVLGAFMAVLDIQITNSSLRDIQGGVAASLDEGSWISTGYLAAEIVAIPLTGWLCRVFSTRRYLLATCLFFLVFSVLCGTASTLNQLVAYRAGQGFTGGALIPVALTIILTRLPKGQRSIGLALFGFSATFGPAFGPTIGGWLTDTFGWQYVFYVNLVPGAVLIGTIWYALDPEPMHLDEFARGDWFGIVTMAVGLACLVAVLEEGQRRDWFSAIWIRWASLTAAVALPAFVCRELAAQRPLVNLRLLADRNLGPSALLAFSLGVGLYGTVYLMPLYLTQVQDYSALEIGRVVMWAGLPQLLIIPFVPMIMRVVDWRLMVGFGFFLFAVSCLMNGYLSHLTAGPQLRLPQLIRAFGQPFMIVPLTSLATARIAAADQANASALFNMMRNLGGSFGTSMISTVATHREHYHFSIIAERVTRNGETAQEWLQLVATRVLHGSLSLPGNMDAALKQLAELVRREAYTMAYADCFFGIGVILLASMAALFLVPRPPASGDPAA